MRWMLVAASAAVSAGLWLPGEAAQPAAAPSGGDTITFEQYRDWRNEFVERRQSQLAIELATPNLAPARKARLTQVKAYYDWLAGLPAAERDRRYRERFEQIDANHDGTIDAAERGVWRDKRRAFYSRSGGPGSARSGSPEAASAQPASADAAAPVGLPAMQ